MRMDHRYGRDERRDSSDDDSPSWPRTALHGLVGGLAGSVLAGVVAVNVVIFSGIDQGYEATLEELFDHNFVLGVGVTAILAAGPVVGAWLRIRRIRD